MTGSNDKEIRLLFLEFIFYIILDILDVLIGQIIMLIAVCATITFHFIYKDIIKEDIRILIRLLSKYEEIKVQEKKELEYTSRIKSLYSCLLKRNLRFHYTPDQKSQIENEKYKIHLGRFSFYIMRIDDGARYMSQEYVIKNPELYNETAVNVLEEFIKYIKENK